MRFQRFIANSLLPLSALLVFLFLFDSRLVLPAWLQVAGRMHPLLLHFPVVLLILYGCWVLLLPASAVDPALRPQVGDFLLLASAFSAVLTAIAGLFLSREPGYNPESLAWHKWSGGVIALFTVAWYYFRNRIASSRLVSGILAFAGIFGIILAGHLGAGITHGQDFLLAPILPEKTPQRAALEDALVFEDLVHPILEAKCIGCHNAKKAKGQLLMETAAQLKKGGKNGVLWDLNQPDLGLLLRRIHLPLDDKKHMPPPGKPQLTAEEAAILYQWIRAGSPDTGKVLELDPSDSLRLLAEKQFSAAAPETYSFSPASETTIRELNNSNRVVYPISMESPALAVIFYNQEFFSSAALEELLKIKDQLVSLDCSHMPLKEEDLAIIGRLPQLRQLFLNFTPITGKNLGQLAGLKKLERISLSGSPVSLDALTALEKLPELQRIYCWGTAIPPEKLEQLSQKTGRLRYITGTRTDTLILQLTPPIFDNEETVVSGKTPLKLKHYINGTQIRYTIDGAEPDSLNASLYDGSFTIDRNLLVKARAFKPGWISSEMVSRYFFRSGIRIDSVELTLPADPKYRSGGPRILADRLKGDFNVGSGKWLGYRNNPMEALLYLNEAQEVQQLTVSALKMIGPYIMPPSSIEVWGGPDKDHLKPLGKLRPTQPIKDEPAAIVPYEINFPRQQLKLIKINIVPLAVLPAWHPGKGDKAWFFVDEILLN